LAFLGLLVCLAGGAVLFFPSIMAAIRPDARVLYGAAPDPVASAHLNSILDDAGLEGTNALVIPIKGEAGQIAIITLDESAGFQGTNAEGFDSLVRSLAQANQEGGYNISRVALDYRDPEGNDLFAVTVDQDSVEAYANGEITRRQLLANTDVDLSNLLEMAQIYAEAE
jgi:hypothetical protein